VIYLIVEHIEALHRRALTEFGGLDGLRAPHQLAAAMLTFLDVNGHQLDRTDDEIAEIFERLGEDVVDQSAFFA